MKKYKVKRKEKDGKRKIEKERKKDETRMGKKERKKWN